MSDTCKTCKFYHELNAHGGQCRRFPPILHIEQESPEQVVYGFVDFPWIPKGQLWCGEHKVDSRKM